MQIPVYTLRINDTKMTDKNTQNDTNSVQISNGQEAQNMSLRRDNAFENKDSIMSFISKKGTQLGTAIYYVTEHLEGEDPMRQELREAVLHLSISTSKFAADYRNNTQIIETGVNITVLVNLLQIAIGSGLVSNMNGEILIGEVNKIKSSIDKLSIKTFLDYGDKGGVESVDLKAVFNEKNEQPQKSFSDANTNTYTPTENDSTKTPTVIKPKTTPTSDKDLAMRHIRRESIIRLLKQRGIVGLNDIKAIIPNLSDKTLQRELMSLIDEGVIVRKGEKRWARYSLR